MDQQGVIPEEFEAACQRWHPKAIYLTPAVQNPTAVVMPLVRRQALAEIAELLHSSPRPRPASI